MPKQTGEMGVGAVGRQDKPRVFIGSSTEGLGVAYAIQEHLKHHVQVTVWKDHEFQQMRGTLESLLLAVPEYDFGVFVLTPDDAITVRSKEGVAPRDNVILELGMFLASHGRERTYAFRPEGIDDFHILSDLLGVTLSLYDGNRPDKNWSAATGPVCQQIIQGMSRSWQNAPARPPAHATQVMAKLHAIQETVAAAYANIRQPFRFQVIENVIDATREEVGSLTRDPYQQNLSLEQNFIIRAGGIFSQASRVYATSIDRLSTFWTSEGQRQRAQRYTEMQPKATRRLFVFSSPASAHEYRNVLAAQHARYGTEGGVFLTTIEKYYPFLIKVIGEAKVVKQLRNVDFALLVFEDPLTNDRESYEATLSIEDLQCRHIPSMEGYRSRLMNEFDRLVDTLNPGKMDDATGILRWREAFADNLPEWRDALRTLFEKPTGQRELQDGDVYHFVFFGPVDEHELGQAIAEEMARLQELLVDENSDERLLKDWWFGLYGESIRNVTVQDGLLQGKLRTKGALAEQYPFCLIMRFSNVEALRRYYEHREHALARERIFKACDPAIAELYRLAREPQLERQKSLIYEAIEAAAARFMFRADYLEHNNLDLIVNSPSVEFRVLRE